MHCAPIKSLDLFDGFLRAVTEQPDRWRAAFTLVDSSTPVFRKRVERGQRELVRILEELVRRAVRDQDTDVELLARTLQALLWSAGRLVLAEPDRFPADRITAFAEHLISTHFPQAS